jgi:hypothetical protein
VTTQWRKPSSRKGSLDDRATFLPKQDWLPANRLNELLRLSSMQISSSRTRRISRHFRHDPPLRANKPSTRLLFPPGAGKKGLSASPPWNTTTTPLPFATLANPWPRKRQSQEKQPRLTIYWLVTIDICPCQSNYGSIEM